MGGALQNEWDSGFMLAADQIVNDHEQTENRVYYEARRVRHEERFTEPAVIGVARWRFGTLVGLRVADSSAGPAVVVTKPFPIASGVFGMLLNVDTLSTSCGS